MRLDEWHATLASEPATELQVGAIQGEFRRFGFRPGDRATRLAICARLLGLDQLSSTHDLTMGQAGWLVAVLRDCGTLADLPRAVPARRPTMAQLMARVLTARLPG